MPLPSAPFDTTKSIFAGRSIIQFTPTVGGVAGTAVVFESIKLDHKVSQEKKVVYRSGTNGAQIPVRSVLTKFEESFEYQLDEAKRLLSDLFGGALAGFAEGTAQLWEPDPNDATGKVAMMSGIFSCAITRQGDLKFGDGGVSIATVTIDNTSGAPVTFTADATVV